MTEPTRFSSATVELPLRLVPELTPVEGCAASAELVAVRNRARAGGDLTTVSDCNVHLRWHTVGHQGPNRPSAVSTRERP
ncbi:hypothetical protein N3K67_01265 [Streptomyces sp. AV19]|nr:hypothetical protein [Streptomyces sp. AV19]MDG4530797.1 hypothetical protein [Streptomyces sp. AV19]